MLQIARVKQRPASEELETRREGVLEDFESPRREFGRRVTAPPLSSTAAGFSSLLSADTGGVSGIEVMYGVEELH